MASPCSRACHWVAEHAAELELLECWHEVPVAEKLLQRGRRPVFDFLVHGVYVRHAERSTDPMKEDVRVYKFAIDGELACEGFGRAAITLAMHGPHRRCVTPECARELFQGGYAM